MEKMFYFVFVGIICLVLARTFPIFLIFLVPAGLGLIGCVAWKFMKGG